ncbi:MAG: nucleoside deaminase [Chloroflexota bacterium]
MAETTSPIQHEHWIRLCINLAQAAKDRGDGPYGAILVYEGNQILQAENTTQSEHDVTRHAEMNLINQAYRQLDPVVLRQCTLYASTEPCAMCAGAIYWAGIPRVVFGCSVRRQVAILNGGLAVDSSMIFDRGNRHITVIGPILEDEAAKVLARTTE